MTGPQQPHGPQSRCGVGCELCEARELEWRAARRDWLLILLGVLVLLPVGLALFYLAELGP